VSLDSSYLGSSFMFCFDYVNEMMSTTVSKNKKSYNLIYSSIISNNYYIKKNIYSLTK
jgi:hypothetical protein